MTMNTDKMNKRESLINRAIEVLREIGMDDAADLLISLVHNGKRSIDLKIGNETHKAIFEVFQALNIVHAYLSRMGVVYFLK